MTDKIPMNHNEKLEELKALLTGEVYNDFTFRHLYATDASAYREVPLAVAFPKSHEDLGLIMQWASRHHVPVVPRAAGTSLAGQVVGGGLVVDTGRYLNQILEIDSDRRTVWVEPGVIRDDLNRALKPFGLHFAPETSTSNRCMIAGMVGNNACGAHSLIYGSTRDHLLEVKGFLSDGTPFHTGPLQLDEFREKLKLSTREGEVYRFLNDLLSSDMVRDEIDRNFPWPEIRRRNTGYALDQIMNAEPWVEQGEALNLSRLIAGSEGTLMLISSVKLSVVPILPEATVLLCAHFGELNEAFLGNLIALKHPVTSIELIDHVILDCTANHQGLKANRFFIQGNPKAVLIIELCGESIEEVVNQASKIVDDLSAAGYGYHFPILFGEDIPKVWELRKAGLGLLSNVEGSAKPVPVIEDTAVRPQDLPAYIAEFQVMLEELGLSCVYYAHISTGELHLRPILDLKNPEDIRLFRTVAERSAALVRKYRGSLSGEHGDGRLRGEFIPFMVGDKIFSYFVGLKKVFDPDGILNPGKITGTPPMDTSLRYSGSYREPPFRPAFNYRSEGGFLQAVERCNGSGDCRRPYWYQGTMCPSYQATLDERLSTRGRANMIREVVSNPDIQSPFSNVELLEVLDHCLSCKGCKSECPSSVDMARYKSEVLHQHYLHHRTPLGVSMVVNINNINRLFVRMPWLYNLAIGFRPVSALVKKVAGIHPKRSLPLLSVPTLETWIRRNRTRMQLPSLPVKGRVILFADEFTSFFDAQIGIKAIELLLKLGYEVIGYTGNESGRAAFSKGKLDHAKRCAEKNITNLRSLVKADVPLVGIEPSALLAFRDEYPDIVGDHLIEDAKNVAKHTFLIEDFLVMEAEKGNITPDQFTNKAQSIVFHGHCHQKSLSRTGSIKKMLELPTGYSAVEIMSGCCGMAGSFGMETRHYNLSMQIGEQILFPYIRRLLNGTLLAMAGTSCRQQVKDGTGHTAVHPIEVIYEALEDQTHVKTNT